MDKKLGLIGCGNMSQAIIGGVVSSKTLLPEDIIVSNPSESKLKEAHDKYKIETTTDNIEVAKVSDTIILAVKPNKYPEVISEIKDHIRKNTIIATIAAGISIGRTEALFEKEVKIARAMPNTPALVKEAMTALCFNKTINDDDINKIVDIFNSCGKSEIVDEKLIDAVTGVSGSSPAYVYMFIEAMADAAVLQGMPRKSAYKFAAQAVLGSAKMVLETDLHPGELKDNVCSPGGTTIDAVRILEKDNFRYAVIDAINTCTEKSKQMSKNN
jgi:pyrroline-5-carboxylate reductase